MKTWIKPIAQLGACQEALEWAEQYDSLDEAWANCERGDWMLWLAGRLSRTPESPERKKLVFTACQCARLTLPYLPKDITLPRATIEIAEAWTRGEATSEQVKQAAWAARAATYAASCVADYASRAATYASRAATYASRAAEVAWAATYAAYAANAATQRQCADIVRKYYPHPPEVNE